MKNMSLLDFSEIPPATGQSQDTEAFEKFSKDFFVELRGATIAKTVGRGPDGGADLVVEVDGEKWLVSCKHYSSGDYAPPGKEEDPAGRLEQWGCKKFIGFYSPGPTSGLEQKIRQTRTNKPSLSFEIMDSGDIERELIANASPKGWLLAFRWFPRSFAQIASSLVFPLQVYSARSVMKATDYAVVPGFSLKAIFRPDDDVAASAATEMLTDYANESATAKSFSSIFLARVADFARLVPGAFFKPVYIDESNLSAGHIFPSWDLTLVRTLCKENNRLGLLNLCRVWSLWDLNLARLAYQFGQLLLRCKKNEDLVLLQQQISIKTLADSLAKIQLVQDPSVIRALDHLTFNEMAKGYTAERGYFAALLCFCPGSLRGHINKISGITVFAKEYNEEVQLREAAVALAKTFSAEDRTYVEKKSPTLADLLTSIEFIESGALDELSHLKPTLHCLSEPIVEIWAPAGNPPDFLHNALGFPNLAAK